MWSRSAEIRSALVVLGPGWALGCCRHFLCTKSTIQDRTFGSAMPVLSRLRVPVPALKSEQEFETRFANKDDCILKK